MLDAHRRDELAKPFRLFAATSSAINIIPNDSCTLCMQLSTTKLLSHEEEPNSAGPIVVRCLASCWQDCMWQDCMQFYRIGSAVIFFYAASDEASSGASVTHDKDFATECP